MFPMEAIVGYCSDGFKVLENKHNMLMSIPSYKFPLMIYGSSHSDPACRARLTLFARDWKLAYDLLC
jgi:hypothetical protein